MAIYPRGINDNPSRGRNIILKLLFSCTMSLLLHVSFLQLQRARGWSLLWYVDFSLGWLLLLQSTGSRCAAFGSCGTQHQQLWLESSRIQVQQLWSMGLLAPRHVKSSQIRDQTCVPCPGRCILTQGPPGKSNIEHLNQCLKPHPFYTSVFACTLYIGIALKILIFIYFNKDAQGKCLETTQKNNLQQMFPNRIIYF